MQVLAVEVRVLFGWLRHELDPLDLEILEREFDDPAVDFESDEGLDSILRRELIEIACFYGVNDTETLRDVLLALPPVRDKHRKHVAGVVSRGAESNLSTHNMSFGENHPRTRWNRPRSGGARPFAAARRLVKIGTV